MVRPSVQRPPTTQDYMRNIVNEIDILKNEFNKENKTDRDKTKINIAIQVIKTNLLDGGLMRVAQYQPSHYAALKTKVAELLPHDKIYQKIMNIIKKSETKMRTIHNNESQGQGMSSSSNSSRESSNTIGGASTKKRRYKKRKNKTTKKR